MISTRMELHGQIFPVSALHPLAILYRFGSLSLVSSAEASGFFVSEASIKEKLTMMKTKLLTFQLHMASMIKSPDTLSKKDPRGLGYWFLKKRLKP